MLWSSQVRQGTAVPASAMPRRGGANWVADPLDVERLVDFLYERRSRVGQGGNFDDTVMNEAAVHMASFGPPKKGDVKSLRVCAMAVACRRGRRRLRGCVVVAIRGSRVAPISMITSFDKSVFYFLFYSGVRSSSKSCGHHKCPLAIVVADLLLWASLSSGGTAIYDLSDDRAGTRGYIVRDMLDMR
ncbi:hypothetical protein B0H10DRAFT_1949716 [Mycena sp. CBHHK59/15]|nr:hypothetical protein B0H10DRAFT_1949716 [Mycena sp. CBHHK59/15]